MNNNYGIIAFIPVRGGSKSIPLKNIKIINGKPLVYWTLEAAVNCKEIERVFVSTDSIEIKNVVKAYGSEKVEIVDRSEEVSSDYASTESVMLEFARKIKFNSLVLIQATSPLLDTLDLSNGINIYKNTNVDSLLSVVRQKRFIWKELNDRCAQPLNYLPQNRPRRQEFDGFLVENGAFYITSRKILLEQKCRLGGKIGFYEMEEESYFEIDEPSDWIIVEQLLKKKNNSLDYKKKLKTIKMVITDSDGVLTDGGMYYSENGDELKKFNTKDGMGVQLLKDNGIKVGIITGENVDLVKKRAQKLKIDEIYLGAKNKLSVVYSIMKKFDLSLEEIAYIGDDINDLEVIEAVGFGCCVADALQKVKNHSYYITKAKGGEGALREIADLILEVKNTEL